MENGMTIQSDTEEGNRLNVPRIQLLPRIQRARSWTSDSGGGTPTSMSIFGLLNPSGATGEHPSSDEEKPPSSDENTFKQEDLHDASTGYARMAITDHLSNEYECDKMEDDEDNNPFQKRGLSCSVQTCQNKAVSKGRCISHGGGCRCKISGCKNGAKMYGLCHLHGGRKKCKYTGCGKFAKSMGLCWAHGGSKTCSHEGCGKGALKGGFCWAHGGGKRCYVSGCQKPVKIGCACAFHCKS